MRVNIKNYMYRWFDNMLILQTEDDNVLYIYCPSECIYNDGISRYYCYKENLQARELLEIDYVDYHMESDSDISCNGIAHFIQYRNDKQIIIRGYRCCKHTTIKCIVTYSFDFNRQFNFNKGSTISKHRIYISNFRYIPIA